MFIVGISTMNPSDPHDTFFRTLAEWRVTPLTDPNFRPAVWQRIQKGTRETWAGYIRAHMVGWSVIGGLAIVAAGWTGRHLAETSLDAHREEMVVNYLGNLDPRVLAKIHPSSP